MHASLRQAAQRIGGSVPIGAGLGLLLGVTSSCGPGVQKVYHI